MDAEKIKLLELTIDFNKLIKDAATSQGKIQELKDEIKRYKDSLKDIADQQDVTTTKLKALSDQGKKNTDAYKNQKDALTKLNSKQTDTQQAIEQVSSRLRDEQKKYRDTKSLVDSYNDANKQSIGVIKDVGGSMNQIAAKLKTQKTLYRKLTAEERDNVNIGGVLKDNIKKLDKAHKDLETSIGTTQVNVGNYTDSIKAAFSGNKDLNKALADQFRKIPLVGGVMANIVTTLTSYKTAQEGVATATQASAAASSGLVRMLKLVRLALIRTGIGAIVVALGTLVAAFLSTQAGVDALNRALAPIKGAFEGIIGVVQKLSVNVFGQLGDRWTVVSDKILKGITDIRIAWNEFTGDTEEAEGLKEYEKKLNTEIFEATVRLNKKTKELSGIWNAAGGEISSAIDKQKQIEAMQIQIENGANKLIITRARENKIIKDNEVIAKDRTKTAKQQQDATEKALAAAKRKMKAEQDQLDLQIKQLKMKQSLNDTSREEEKELATLQAKKINAEETYQTTVLRFGRSRTTIAKAYQNEQIKNTKALLDLYIAQNKDRAKTLDENLEYFKTIRDKKIAVVKKEFKLRKKTKTEYDKDVIVINNEFLRNQTNAVVKHANKEIDIYKKKYKEELKSKKNITPELYAEEVERLDHITELQKKALEARYKAHLLLKKDYDAKLKAIDKQNVQQKDKLTQTQAQREIDTYKKVYQQRLEDNKEITPELYAEEVARLDHIAELEKKALQASYDDHIISKKEFDDKIKAIDQENRDQKNNLADAQAQKEIDRENELHRHLAIMAAGNRAKELAEETRHQKAMHDIKVKAAKQTGKDTTKIDEEYAKKQADISYLKWEYELNLASQFFGNMATILGENTKAGKAAAIAQTTIDTYVAAQKAFNSLVETPFVGPVLGAAAAAAAIVAGLARVKKISAVSDDIPVTQKKETTLEKPKLAKGGYIQGRSHSQGGVPFSVAGEAGFEAEGGEFIVNKAATAYYRPLLEMVNKQVINGANYRYTPPIHLFASGGYLEGRKGRAGQIDTEQLAQKIGEYTAQANKANYDNLAEMIGEYTAQANKDSLPTPVVTVQELETERARQLRVTQETRI